MKRFRIVDMAPRILSNDDQDLAEGEKSRTPLPDHWRDQQTGGRQVLFSENIL